MNKLERITVIPAQPGYYTIYDNDHKEPLSKGEMIIAWRVETEYHQDGDYYTSYSYPITLEGDPCSNWVGYLCPDKSVHMHMAKFESLEQANVGYNRKSH